MQESLPLDCHKTRYLTLWSVWVDYIWVHIYILCQKSSYTWARPWENVSYAICKQQRRRSACASTQSDQRLCYLLPKQNDTSSLYIRNFKILAGLCSWTVQHVSCLVRDSRRHIFSWRGSHAILFVTMAAIDVITPDFHLTMTWQNVSSGVSHQARHKLVCAATEAS